MYELSREKCLELLGGMRVPDHRPIFEAVLEGTLKGKAYGDDPINPRSVLVWSCMNFLLVTGDAGNKAFLEGLSSLLFDTILPTTDNKFIILLNDSDDWLPGLDEVLLPRFFIKKRRATLKLDKDAFRARAAILPGLPEGYEMVAGERDGFPCRRIYLDGAEVAITASVVGRCEGEMDVITQEDHRRKGLSSYATADLINGLLGRGIMPVWTCWTHNQASLGLADKLGFIKYGEAELHVWVPDFVKQ